MSDPLKADERDGSGHDLNNGALIVSPLGQAGVYGGVDKATCMTYGFDLSSGSEDEGRRTNERELFAGIRS